MGLSALSELIGIHFPDGPEQQKAAIACQCGGPLVCKVGYFQ